MHLKHDAWSAHDAAAAPYPVALHVGRDDELKLAVRQLGGGTSSRLIVEGAPGVGKTSFVNKLKAEVTHAGMLTHADPVRIVADSTVLSFVADVLRVLLRIRTARGLDTDAFWTRTARLVEGEDTMSGGLTLGRSAFRTRAAASRRRLPSARCTKPWPKEWTG